MIRRKRILIIVVGVVVAVSWGYGFSPIFHFFYLAMGSPDQPTIWLKLALYFLSFIWGLLSGAVVGKLLSQISYKQIGLLIAVVFLTILLVAYAAAGFQGVLNQLNTVGFWFILLGVFVGGLFYGKSTST